MGRKNKERAPDVRTCRRSRWQNSPGIRAAIKGHGPGSKSRRSGYPGKGELILTGSLGDVMRESARIALSYIKANSKEYKLECVKKYKNGEHIQNPGGCTHKTFHDKVRHWVRISDKLGEVGLDHKKLKLTIDDKIEIEEKNVLYLATDEEIENCYDFNLEKWVKLAEQYEAADETAKKTLRENNEDLAYVFDTVDNILSTSKTPAEKKIAIRQKIASYLFIELEWLFSSDSLGNEYSNKRGYVMSNYPDERGSWVSEFAYGARDLIKQLKGKKNDGTYTYETVQEGLNALLSGNIADFDASKLTNKIISTYGYHIIKVEDVFEGGSSLVDLDTIKTSLSATVIDLDNEAHLNAVVKAINETYVCSGSNQTLYNYYFDQLYTKLVGSSWLGDTSDKATSGTYFLKLEYEWLYELYQADKVEHIDKVGYKELLESIK